MDSWVIWVKPYPMIYLPSEYNELYVILEQSRYKLNFYNDVHAPKPSLRGSEVTVGSEDPLKNFLKGIFVQEG